MISDFLLLFVFNGIEDLLRRLGCPVSDFRPPNRNFYQYVPLIDCKKLFLPLL